MDWRTKVELFEQIRREYEFGVSPDIKHPQFPRF